MQQCQLFEIAAEQRSGTGMNARVNSVFSLGTNRMRTVLFQNGIHTEAAKNIKSVVIRLVYYLHELTGCFLEFPKN